MGAFVQFERELIRERQREGIAIVKREGKYTDGKQLLVSSASVGIRYIGRFRSKSAGSGSIVCTESQEETMSESEMQAGLERLRAENAQLKSKDKGGLTLKVSEKGGVSLYGMGRFPVTLYKEQWLRILASAAEIEAFIRENDSKLKTKE